LMPRYDSDDDTSLSEAASYSRTILWSNFYSF
jgi:hypothetical protein